MYTAVQLTRHITVIQGITREKMFLVTGEKEACLVDAGLGYGRLDRFVSDLTRLPLTVLLTHGHLDHTGGSFLFSRVYLHHADEELFYTSYSPAAAYHYWKEVRGADPTGNVSAASFCERTPVALRFYAPGQEFDLGGVTLRVLPCAGHTRGSVAILVCEDRLLITGDACNPATYLFFDESETVDAYRKNLLWLKQQEEAWDRLLFSHYEVMGLKSTLTEVIRVCEDVLRGEDDAQPFAFGDSRALIAKRISSQETMERFDHKQGNILYSPNKKRNQ